MSITFPALVSNLDREADIRSVWAVWLDAADTWWKGSQEIYVDSDGQLTVDLIGKTPSGEKLLAARYVVAIGTPTQGDGLRLITMVLADSGAGALMAGSIHAQTHDRVGGLGTVLAGPEGRRAAEQTDFIMFAGEWPDIRLAD